MHVRAARGRQNQNERLLDSTLARPSEATHAADQMNRCAQQTPFVRLAGLLLPCFPSSLTGRPKPQNAHDKNRSMDGSIERPAYPTRTAGSTRLKTAGLFDSSSLTALEAPRGRARGRRYDRRVVREVEVREGCSDTRGRVRDRKLGVLERHSCCLLRLREASRTISAASLLSLSVRVLLGRKTRRDDRRDVGHKRSCGLVRVCVTLRLKNTRAWRATCRNSRVHRVHMLLTRETRRPFNLAPTGQPSRGSRPLNVVLYRKSRTQQNVPGRYIIPLKPEKRVCDSGE